MRDNPRMSHRLPERDKPWMMRTYAGHSTAARSNALYRGNLAKGQTGLSIAFDLPTQTGYDADHELARGEVGKVGVPVAHRGDMRALLDGIPLDRMNTSMTINATAAWLLALYVVCAEEQGVDAAVLQGTTQNDIIKEYLSRGTYAFPPAPSMRLIADTVAYAVEHLPRWNPVNICSYHLQEAGATPVQEIAFAMATAQAVLDEVRPRVGAARMGSVFGRISFFVNAGVRFVEEHAKLRAMAQLWEALGRERYGVEDPQAAAVPLWRAGQLARAHGVPAREQRAADRARGAGRHAGPRRAGPGDPAARLERGARAAAAVGPAVVPADPAGARLRDRPARLPRPLRGLARHGGAHRRARRGRARGAGPGGRARRGRRGRALHEGRAGRVEPRPDRPHRGGRAGARGRQPLPGDRAVAADRGGAEGGGSILTVDPAVEAEQVAALEAWRAGRDAAAVRAALAELARVAAVDENVMPATLAAARAGATTGEWAQALRDAFGSYRAPTGVGAAAAPPSGAEVAALRDEVARVAEQLGRGLKILVGKPGLDGHSNGAEQIAVRARDAGLEVVYEGIRLTPAQIARSAVDEGVHVIGLSILSGSHRELIPDVLEALRAAGGEDIPVVVGGIIPDADAVWLRAAGVAGVYTPKDFELTRILREVVGLVAERNGIAAAA